MLKDVEYDELSIDFTCGDRLFLYSDGVPECSNQDGLPFSTERLVGFLEENHQRPLKELMFDLEGDLRAWRKDEPFEDDVSCLVMEAA